MLFSIRLNIGRRHDATSWFETNLPWRFGKGCLSCTSCKNDVFLSAFAHCSLLLCVAILGGQRLPAPYTGFGRFGECFVGAESHAGRN